MSNKQKPKFKVLAPLSNFNWNGDNFSIANLYTIQRLPAIPNLPYCENYLSTQERKNLSAVSHWLSFEQSQDEKLSASEKVNMFLLALWMVLPTRTHVKFRFELSNGACIDKYSPVSRLLDRFQWIAHQVEDEIETVHLKEMQGYLEGIIKIHKNQNRLQNSAHLTFSGCTKIHWQVAFICFCAAAEGILGYRDDADLAERLAKSFACLTKTSKAGRDSAYKAFKRSYNIRSCIMHGRAKKLTVPNKNLKELALFSDLLRELWKTVLSSDDIMTELEKNDKGRKAWLNQNEQGYQPPQI